MIRSTQRSKNIRYVFDCMFLPDHAGKDVGLCLLLGFNGSGRAVMWPHPMVLTLARL